MNRYLIFMAGLVVAGGAAAADRGLEAAPTKEHRDVAVAPTTATVDAVIERYLRSAGEPELLKAKQHVTITTQHTGSGSAAGSQTVRYSAPDKLLVARTLDGKTVVEAVDGTVSWRYATGHPPQAFAGAAPVRSPLTISDPRRTLTELKVVPPAAGAAPGAVAVAGYTRGLQPRTLEFDPATGLLQRVLTVTGIKATQADGSEANEVIVVAYSDYKTVGGYTWAQTLKEYPQHLGPQAAAVTRVNVSFEPVLPQSYTLDGNKDLWQADAVAEVERQLDAPAAPAAGEAP